MFGWNIDLGLDVGTCTTRIYQRGVGLVLAEPSAIAFSLRGGDRSSDPVAVGGEAKLIGDQGSDDARTVFPVRGGATISARCPLPSGQIRSTTRTDVVPYGITI